MLPRSKENGQTSVTRGSGASSVGVKGKTCLLMDLGAASFSKQSHGQQPAAAAASPTTTAELREGVEQTKHTTTQSSANIAQRATSAIGTDDGAGGGNLAATETPLGENFGSGVHATTAAAAAAVYRQQQQQHLLSYPGMAQPQQPSTAIDQRELEHARPPPRTVDMPRIARVASSQTQAINSTDDREKSSSLPEVLLVNRGISNINRHLSSSTSVPLLGGASNDNNNNNARLSATRRSPTDAEAEERHEREQEEQEMPTSLQARVADIDTTPASCGGTVVREAGARDGGGGDDGSSSGRLALREAGDVVLTEERVAAVRCYLRDDDPIFVRRNLKRLLEGTLVQLAVGDTVTVARR